MAGKTERTVNSPGTGKKEGKGEQDSIAANLGEIFEVDRGNAPLLVDANQGARMLGVSLSHFYKFMRTNQTAPTVTIGTLNMWRRKDLLQFIGKSDTRRRCVEDALIDAKTIAELCSISRSMVYKLNEQKLMPEPFIYGRTLRWSLQALEEWVENECPPRKKQPKKPADRRKK